MTGLSLGEGVRLSVGADEFVFVELSEEMSLKRTLQVLAITNEIRRWNIPGVIDVCPAHVSYMLRISPEDLRVSDLVEILRQIHTKAAGDSSVSIRGRLIEMPIFYDDPWTRETLMRFRDRHQAPETDDLTYCARVNGFDNAREFIAAHSSSPFIATFIGFIAGNAECYQLVPQERQLEAPKYLRPRTDTPERAIGHGGAFSTIYPVRSAGGFQLLGRSPAPVFDIDHRLEDFQGSIVLPRGGDIFKYRPIDSDEYDSIRAQVEAGSYRYSIHETEFDLAAFESDPEGYNRSLLKVLR